MWSIILLAIFFVAMIVIGLWGMKKTSSLNDFFLGSRSIGPWVSAIAYGTSYFSAVLFIGFAGKLGWGFGLNALWIAAGNALIGSLGAWLVLGRRTRIMTQNLDVMTMPEFLQERFEGKNIKIYTAILIFIFLLPYSASVFKGLGHLFEVNFNISYDVALLIMIALTGFYLVLGGYFAITLTDFIQGIIMVVGSIAMIAVLMNEGGGVPVMIDKINQGYRAHIGTPGAGHYIMLAALVFMTSFGVWGLPQMVQKYYAIRDQKVIRTAAWVTTGFAVIVVFAAYLNGAMTHAFYDAIPLVEGKPAFDRLIPDLLKSHLPAGLMALILLLVLSASMSTLSSLVLVSSSSVAIDLYKGHINPQVSKDNSLMMMRFLSGLFIIISYFIAKFKIAIIVTLMALSWGVVAGSFMAPYIFALYWKRTTRAGVWAGMLSGGLTTVVLFFVLGASKSPIASSLGMIVPFLVTPLVSIMTSPPSREVLDRSFEGI
jgi:SSS family solute:Na+ symporter